MSNCNVFTRQAMVHAKLFNKQKTVAAYEMLKKTQIMFLPKKRYFILSGGRIITPPITIKGKLQRA